MFRRNACRPASRCGTASLHERTGAPHHARCEGRLATEAPTRPHHMQCFATTATRAREIPGTTTTDARRRAWDIRQICDSPAPMANAASPRSTRRRELAWYRVASRSVSCISPLSAYIAPSGAFPVQKTISTLPLTVRPHPSARNRRRSGLRPGLWLSVTLDKGPIPQRNSFSGGIRHAHTEDELALR
jgi:hypothetical protein